MKDALSLSPFATSAAQYLPSRNFIIYHHWNCPFSSADMTINPEEDEYIVGVVSALTILPWVTLLGVQAYYEL